MSTPINHAEWLSLIDVSGPFLSIPVLDKVFPQGLDVVEPSTASRVRSAYEEWRESTDDTLQQAWTEFILGEVLEYESRVLKTDSDIPAALRHTVAEHGVELRPSAVLVEPGDATAARLLVAEWPATQKDLQQATAVDSWAASPAERMTELCRATGVRLGLVTNGEQWLLVDAPQGETPAYVTWYASFWIEERITLQAFRSLLGVQRFFAASTDETLEQMLADSVQYQAEVTDQLGAQVRRAVEVLIQALDKADADAGRKLLGDIPESVLYEASITVMMRLVFLFCAEERDLLLLGDPVYDQYYAVSTLRSILREEADQHGIEVLERRQDAWSRLLASFRGIYGGIDHESLRLPAYGGSLFDPDRFPFLEGRAPGTSWREDLASPLPVDNRTVLHLLEALQLLQMKGKGGVVAARKLSFRALDIEQIGHVYESLLDHTAVRADIPTLGLVGKLGGEPEVSLPAVEEQWMAGEESLLDFLHDETGKSKSALQKLLLRDVESEWSDQLKRECGDSELYKRVEPFHALVREDPWGDPIVMCPGDIYVTTGTDRRSSGTHYTPKALTEEIVRYTLEPLAYLGPAAGKPRAEWELRPAAELLGLKICDPAMGSGAFLVQVVRWLAERIVEAWDLEQAVESQVENREERVMHARRLVAERCVYGVDVNPLAVEMGKLSLWLVTLSKGRPFGFLDHALRCGDSLLGIHDLDQIRYFHPDPVEGRKRKLTFFDPGPLIEGAIDEAESLRVELESFEVLDVRDAQQKDVLLARAADSTAAIRVVADLVSCAAISTAGHPLSELETRLRGFESQLAARPQEWLAVGEEGRVILNLGVPGGRPNRHPFHWPLEFPEVFAGGGGFDAMCMNPPFMGGQKISGVLGDDYRAWLGAYVAGGVRGSADLSALFLRRAAVLLGKKAIVGTLATNTIAQGDTRTVGLEALLKGHWVVTRAVSSRPWPGAANLEIAEVWLGVPGVVATPILDGGLVTAIDASFREPSRVVGPALALRCLKNQYSNGSALRGAGFVIDEVTARAMLVEPCYADVIKPYLNADELYSVPTPSSDKWAVCFWGWTHERAGQYPQALGLVEERVRPQRNLLDDAKLKSQWWLYERPRLALYRRLATMSRTLLIGRVTKTVLPIWVPSDAVFSDSSTVITYDDDGHFGLLSSAFHWWWAVTRSSTMRRDTRYAPTDCFVNFPQPLDLSGVAPVGRTLHEHRAAMMLDRQLGMTATYNLVIDESCSDQDVEDLRCLHRELDEAVAHAYGWDDLVLDHDFYETKWGPRYTVGSIVRQEILDRLLELNHERYAEEVAQGLHDKGAKKTKKRTVSPDTQSLF